MSKRFRVTAVIVVEDGVPAEAIGTFVHEAITTGFGGLAGAHLETDTLAIDGFVAVEELA